VQAAEHDPRQRALIRALAQTAQALDGTRPVTANDGWETLGGEILGIHDYARSATVLAARYGTAEALEAAARSRGSTGHLRDLDRAGTQGRAVVLSEFGGISLAAGEPSADGSTPWGYDDVRTPDELLDRYRDLWSAVHDTPLAGACWTQLTDTYQEVNGLLTADRTPKCDVEQLRRATIGINR
jgi:hypothetical protein